MSDEAKPMLAPATPPPAPPAPLTGALTLDLDRYDAQADAAFDAFLQQHADELVAAVLDDPALLTTYGPLSFDVEDFLVLHALARQGLPPGVPTQRLLLPRTQLSLRRLARVVLAALRRRERTLLPDLLVQFRFWLAAQGSTRRRVCVEEVQDFLLEEGTSLSRDGCDRLVELVNEVRS